MFTLDHLVLTVADIERTVAFYTRVLHMEAITYGAGRRALRFGNQKINLHEVGHTIAPHALRPTPGTADLCFLTTALLEGIAEDLADCGVPILEGPVERMGATGPILSLYFRDPDGNLIEVANLLDAFEP
ncbi:MAG: VOC family protein [Armatimonas sp.]